MSLKISELTAASALDGSEEVPLTQSGSTKKVTVNDLLPVQLQEDKEIDLNGEKFSIFQGGNDFFELDPTLNAESIYVQAFNATGDGNYGKLAAIASDVIGQVTIYSAFNDGNEAAISFESAIDGSTLAYTADTHTITGAIITPSIAALDFIDDAAAATGGVAVGQWYHTSGTLKIRLA